MSIITSLKYEIFLEMILKLFGVNMVENSFILYVFSYLKKSLSNKYHFRV